MKRLCNLAKVANMKERFCEPKWITTILNSVFDLQHHDGIAVRCLVKDTIEKKGKQAEKWKIVSCTMNAISYSWSDFFLTSSTHAHIWNKAPKEDYCSTEFYCIAAFFARLLWTAICNSLADEAALRECSRISYYIDLGKRASCFGEHASDCGAGLTRTNAQEEHFTLLLVLLV